MYTQFLMPGCIIMERYSSYIVTRNIIAKIDHPKITYLTNLRGITKVKW